MRRPVLIVGRPLNPPTIDAHLAYRAFLVEAGGALDLRHVVIYRGKPILVIEPDIFFEVRGAAAYIRNGGAAFFTDCVMLLHEDTVSEFLVTPNPQSTVRMSGGFLLLEAGTLHVVGCHILVQRPGEPWMVWAVGVGVCGHVTSTRTSTSRSNPPWLTHNTPKTHRHQQTTPNKTQASSSARCTWWAASSSSFRGRSF